MKYLALTGQQLDQIGTSIGLKPTLGTPGGIVSEAVTYFFPIAGFAMAVFIVFSGFALMNSKGDPRAVESAKAKLTYAIIGFLLVFASYWIVQITGDILDIQVIKDIF
jgi:hypothetical protein